MSCSSPPAGEAWTGVSEQPLLFCAWDPGDTNLRWSAQTGLSDPITYYGGFKEDRMVELSEIRRSMSGNRLDFEMSTFSVLFSDEDYSIRETLRGQPFLGGRLAVWGVTPAGAHAGSTAKLIALGGVSESPVYDERPAGLTTRLAGHDFLSSALGWGSEGQTQLPRRRINSVTLPGCMPEAEGKAGQIPIGILASTTVPPTRVSGKVRGIVSRTGINIPGWNGDAVEVVIAGCAIKQIDHYYYDNFVNDPEVDTGEGTHFLLPMPGTQWDTYITAGTYYRDITGGDAVVRRWTTAYARGTKAYELASGSAQISFDLHGIDAIGDSSGGQFDNLYDQFTWLLYNQVLVEDEGPTTTWNAPPASTFPYAYCKVDADSLNTIRLSRIADLGGAGLVGAGVLGGNGELVDMAEEVKRWCLSGDFRLGPNRFWQIAAHAINETVSSGFTTVSDKYDVHQRTLKITPMLADLQNVFPYRYARNFCTSNWDSGDLVDINQTSIDAWKLRRESAPLEFHYLQDGTMASYVVTRLKTRLANPPEMVQFEGPTFMMDAAYDLGKYLKLTHWRGAASGGWVEQPLWVMASAFIPSTGRVRLDCLNLEGII